jgi:hypothetical protein
MKNGLITIAFNGGLIDGYSEVVAYEPWLEVETVGVLDNGKVISIYERADKSLSAPGLFVASSKKDFTEGVKSKIIAFPPKFWNSLKTVRTE